jgi:hypothetical protein
MSFSTTLESILGQYFPNNTAPTGLQAKIDTVYDSSDNIGAFVMANVVKPKYSNKQVDVTFDDQDFEYKIVYNDGTQKTRTFYASIPNGTYDSSDSLYSAIEFAFQQAVFFEKDGTRKNLTDHLGFNSKWKIVDGKLKLLIPSSVSNFVISELKYKHVVNTNDAIDLADDADLISSVIATWDGNMSNIPAGGLDLPLKVSSLDVQSNGKIYIKDASGDYYFSTIPNGSNTTVDNLITVFETAGATAYYRDSSDNKQFTESDIQLSFNTNNNTIEFADSGSVKASQFVAINQHAYNVYGVTDETGLLSGIQLSQLTVDNRTGNLDGNVAITAASNDKLKYEVVYIDDDKEEKVFVNTVTIAANASYDISSIAVELNDKLNVGLSGENLGSWAVSVNQIKDGSGNLVNTNNLKVVYDADSSAGNAGTIDGGNKKSIVRVRFLPVDDSAYQILKIQGSVYDNIRIKKNIVYNKTGVIKALPDAGLTVNGTLQYQIIYTDLSNNNSNHNDVKSASVSGTFQTVEALASEIETQLKGQDPRWSVSWVQGTQKFDIKYTPDQSGNNILANVQVKFYQNALSNLIGVSQILYNSPSSSQITISVNQFIQQYVTIPANSSIEVIVNGVVDPSSNTILSRSYLSGNALAAEVDQGNLLAIWKEDHLELAWNKESQSTTDVVTLRAKVSGIESSELRNLLKLGGNFFEVNGIDQNVSNPLQLWKALDNTTHNVTISVPNIKDLFPDASNNIKGRFFADASDNILDIYRLTDGLKDVILDNSISYKKALGLTGGSHIENDYADSQDDLRIQVLLGGATAGSQMYTVTVNADSAVRIYDVHVTSAEFEHISDASAQDLIQNMIENTYDKEFYEMIRDNVEVKTKELVQFILEKWIVAVNNDPQSSEYLNENVIGDLKNQILQKIAPDASDSVFSLISVQEYATLVQAFQNVLPQANGSSYIALRDLENNEYLADPLVIYNALRKDNDNIYDILGIDNRTAEVEEFLKEYYDRLLRSYAELVRRKLLLPQDNLTVFKPSNLAVALAASVELNIGNRGTISEPGNMNEYFNSIDLSDNTNAAKLSDLINAIAHNIYDNIDRKTSSQLLTGVMSQTVSDSLEHTKTLLEALRNEEHESSVHGGDGVSRSKGLGQITSSPTTGHSYLAAIMLSHHLLHTILVDGSGSLFNDSTKLTESRWERLMLAYEQEGRCLSVDIFEREDYSPIVNITGQEGERMKRLASGLYKIFSTDVPSVDADIKNIGNLHAYVSKLFERIDKLNREANLNTDAEQTFNVVAVSGAIHVDSGNSGELLLVGKHNDEGKVEGILRYYIDTLYNFIVLEGATSPHPNVVLPFHQVLGTTDVGKGLTHSLFYRMSLENNFQDILRTLGNHYSTVQNGTDYFEKLDKLTTGVSSIATLLADPSMNMVGETWAKEQINEVVVQKISPIGHLNNKMRVRIFGTSLGEDPSVGRTVMSATPEMQAQVNQMKFFESYLQRFSDIDQGLLIGLLIQYDKRIEQQEQTTEPAGVKLSAVDYLNEIHSYLSSVVKKLHLRETQYAVLEDPYEEASSTRTADSQSIISGSISYGGGSLIKARDVIVLGQSFEIIREQAVDLWKTDIVAAINIENVRYNLESGSPNDISEFLNMYEKAVNEIEKSITTVVNNQSVVERTLQLLTIGLSGSTEDRIVSIEESTREVTALERSKEMLDCLVVVIGILNVKIEQLIAAQQELDVKIANYNRLVSILQSQITDLQNVYAALPPQYSNFSQLAQVLSESLNLALKKRDEVSGKVSQLRMFLDNAKLAYNIQKDFKINRIVLPDQLGRGFTFSISQQGLFQ